MVDRSRAGERPFNPLVARSNRAGLTGKTGVFDRESRHFDDAVTRGNSPLFASIPFGGRHDFATAGPARHGLARPVATVRKAAAMRGTV